MQYKNNFGGTLLQRIDPWWFYQQYTSSLICQCLLERKTLNLQTAYNQVYSLDPAQHNTDLPEVKNNDP